MPRATIHRRSCERNDSCDATLAGRSRRLPAIEPLSGEPRLLTGQGFALKKADREHADIAASSVRVAAEEHPVLVGVVELAWAVAFLLFPLPCHLPKQNSV